MENFREALLYKKSEEPMDQSVKCLLCSNYCNIDEGKTGNCLVRKNINGKLYSMNWGTVQGLAIDPIEKKPFFHFKPSSKVLSFGTPGCNFRCLNCQNWTLSQSVREKQIKFPFIDSITPENIVETAKYKGVDGLAYTYSEPTIFFEFVRDTILECRNRKETKNLFHTFISNGYFSKECWEIIKKEKLLEAINIDLKFTDDIKYEKICGGKFNSVLDSIKRINDEAPQILLEIINLVIPGENDKDEDFDKISKIIYSVNPEIPLHFSRFYPQYKMEKKSSTNLETLLNAKKISEQNGLSYIYIGNTNIENAENTYCPSCKTLLVKQNEYQVTSLPNEWENIKGKPVCPSCNHKINIKL